MEDTAGGSLGRRAEQGKRSFFQSLSQLWKNARMPEVRDVATYQGGADLSLRGESTTARTFLKDPDAFIASHRTRPMTEGETFGEIAALSRTPRTATVFAGGDLELVELRWQGLRDIRRRDRSFRDYIDGLYRQRGWSRHIAEPPLFAHLDEATLEIIAAETLFETHGEFEWWSSYKKAVGRDAEEVLKLEPVIAEEGAYLDGLIIIRSGFARISERLDHGERTVGYATNNDLFGLEEIVQHWREGSELRWRRSLRPIVSVDVLRVPTALVEEYVLPYAPAHPRPTPGKPESAPAWEGGGDESVLEQTLIDFLVDNRTINGTATMLIDTDRCVGCDDCVRACASTHDNNPRFVRHGPSHDNIQVANACMHCVDPVCLIGCPTGAIARNFADGRVMIDDRICIGCGTCANSCPYNNIQLVEIRDGNGSFIIDSESKQPIVKAAKCDLCYGQLGGPACERACPHDALIRIDMHDQRRLAEWVNRA
jgi:Fe-S-cluster-containing dehydrogenase component/CRP-like cAMP-binding protein